MQAWKLGQRVKAKKGSVGVGVGQVVPGDVGHGANAVIDVVVLRVVDDVLGYSLGVAKHALFAVEGSQVNVHHLGMVSNPYLN